LTKEIEEYKSKVNSLLEENKLQDEALNELQEELDRETSKKIELRKELLATKRALREPKI
jgi:hypothetical protein